MSISKDIIHDLFPLYAAKECSADSRAMVDEYLAQHPNEADELRRAMSGLLSAVSPLPNHLSEMNSLKRSRKQLQLQSLLMGFAIFLTLSPFAFFHIDGKTNWLFAKSPAAAGVYLAFGAVCWLAYFVLRQNSPLR